MLKIPICLVDALYLMTYDNTPAENLFLVQSSVKFNMSAERLLFGRHFLHELFYNLTLSGKTCFGGKRHISAVTEIKKLLMF